MKAALGETPGPLFFYDPLRTMRLEAKSPEDHPFSDRAIKLLVVSGLFYFLNRRFSSLGFSYGSEKSVKHGKSSAEAGLLFCGYFIRRVSFR
jgi:hypothetical protein